MDQKLIHEIENWFQQYQGTITAFSGGIDSAWFFFFPENFWDEKERLV